MRDLAILTVLARLGLRAAEVAGLSLEDIDWRAGELVVRGKGGRSERLPLPVDVGEAIVGYLRDGRPSSAQDRAVFARVRAPHPSLSPGTVTYVVEAAALGAGLGQSHAHRLRHTAASEMLRAGATVNMSSPLLWFQQQPPLAGRDRRVALVARSGCESEKEQDPLSVGRGLPRHVPDNSRSPRHITGRVLRDRSFPWFRRSRRRGGVSLTVHM
jgi:hypothetical protein